MIRHHVLKHTSLFLAILFSTLFHTLSTQAYIIPNKSLLPRNSNAALSVPKGYTLSWEAESLRASVMSKSAISYHALTKRGSITQGTLDECSKNCNATSACVFFQLFQVSGSTQGTVYCSLYSSILTSHAANFSNGPRDGNVIASYGFKRPPIKTMFPLPRGASLVQFDACNVSATIPLLVNNQFNSSDASAAYIVQHGIKTNPASYFSMLYSLVKTSDILVAPGFYETDHAPAPASYYQPKINLAWEASTGSWTGGDDAVAPNSVSCSTFDVYDAILKYFSDTSLFPNLDKVYFVGHSAGSNTISRYSQVYNGQYSFSIRWVIANSANQAYFTDARPESDNCNAAYDYPYEIVKGSMNRYVKAAYENGQINFINWIGLDIVTLIGQNDTASEFPHGIENCQSLAQGGINRRDRNYAWWAYKNILAGTMMDASKYYGYNQLIDSGASPLLGASLQNFNHQNCNVPDVGHEAEDMFTSTCGIEALFDETVASGPDPSS